MKRRKGWLALTIAGALAACGSSEEAAPAPAAPATPPAAAAPAAPAPAAAAAAPAAAPAEAAEPTFEERVAQTPPTVPTPAAQTAGPVSLTAEVCTYDGPPNVTDDTFTAIGAIAQAPDGSLYLLDGEGRLRHYTVAPGDSCSLVMDTAFGEGGRMNLGEGLGRRPKSLAVDAAGRVYVASSMGGVTRVTNGQQDWQCTEARGDLVVSPDGQSGFVWFGSGPVRRVTFTDEGCTVADWSAAEIFERIDSVAFLDERRVLVGGQSGDHSSPRLARLYDLEGRPQSPAFGDTTGSLSAPDHFCYVHGAIPGAEGRVHVLDGNCRSFRTFDSSRAILGKLDLMRLVGLRYPWFPGVTRPRDGVAYLTAVQERGSRTDVHDGFVFRLRGL